MNNPQSLIDLNSDVNLDCSNNVNTLFGNEPDNPYNVHSCESLFHDNSSFVNKSSNASKPTFLSLNVRGGLEIKPK
jgi:hypothetical protein